MKRTAILTILTLLLAPCLVDVRDAEARGPVPIEGIPTALVIDNCREYTDPLADPPLVPDISQTSEVSLIDFLGGSVRELDFLASNHEFGLGGVAFASLPGYERTHLFVAEGDKINVYYIEQMVRTELDELLWDYDDAPIQLPPVKWTIDIGNELGISDLELGRIATGRWVGVEAGPGQIFGQAALYLVGTRPNDKAYYIVLDQQWLIEGNPPNGGTQVYGFGQVCSGPTECTISQALDIRVGDLSSATYTEEAYINTVQRFGTTDIQVSYRLERGIPSTSFTLTPQSGSLWLDPDNPSQPPKVASSGLRFAPGSHDVYVPRKFEETVRNLTDSSESCVLPGEPTDVATWEPGVASTASRYLFVPTWDGTSGSLEILPAGNCLPNPLTATLSIPIGAEATSLDLYPVDDNELWVLVVSAGDQLFEAIHLEFDSPGGADAFDEVETIAYSMTSNGFWPNSCPSFVSFGLRDLLVRPAYLGKKLGLGRRCAVGDPRCPPPPGP